MYCIGINAQLLSRESGYRRAGIHHYIAQILGHLPPDDRLRYLIFTAHTENWERSDVEQVASRWQTENRWLRILWEQAVWPWVSLRKGVDLIHSMAFVAPLWSHVPAMVTVYDLSFIQHPERFPALQRLYLSSQTRRSCRQARRIVTISESGRQDVHRLYGVPLERIDVIQPGVDETFRPLPQEAVSAFRRSKGLPDQFVLHVGTLQPRKNIPILIDAIARLKRRDLPLILVGGKGWLYDDIFARIEEQGLQKQVRFAGYVPDHELPLWYNAASMLVFPSVYEGFGMPVIQAMACGTPVIAAATSAIPEVAGDVARLFPPRDIDSLIGHMITLLDKGEDAAVMRQRGLDHARRYSWSRSGKEMTRAYLRALNLDTSNL